MSKINSSKENENKNLNVVYKPKQPNFPNPSSKQTSKASYVNGKTNIVKNINHWLERKRKLLQLGKHSQEQIKKVTSSILMSIQMEVLRPRS